eukprot:5650028-Amphidinium_carterae.1
MASAMGEPDLDCLRWFFEGAPMGLELPVPASGLYSPSDLDQVNISEDAGWTNGEDEFNYESVDGDEAAQDEIQ